MLAFNKHRRVNHFGMGHSKDGSKWQPTSYLTGFTEVSSMPIYLPSITYIHWAYYKTWYNNILHLAGFWLTYLAWFGDQVAAGHKEEVWSSFKFQRIRFNEFRALPMFLLLALMVVFVVSGVPKTCQKRRVSSPAADATVYPSGLWKNQLIRVSLLLSISWHFHVSKAWQCCTAVLKYSKNGMRKEYAHLRQVQNSWSVASKLCHLDHRGIFP
jgi:hypothetical protein